MRDQESKYETYSFMKMATNIMLTQMSAKARIKKIVEKAVSDTVKEYTKILYIFSLMGISLQLLFPSTIPTIGIPSFIMIFFKLSNLCYMG